MGLQKNLCFYYFIIRRGEKQAVPHRDIDSRKSFIPLPSLRRVNFFKGAGEYRRFPVRTVRNRHMIRLPAVQ